MSTKKLAVLQPNYIPWKGYFDLVRYVDEFVFLVDVQYTRNDWRNRNLIKTRDGLKWLTLPVEAGESGMKINEARIKGTQWRNKHWMSLVHSYSKARYFETYHEKFSRLYLENEETLLCPLAISFIREISQVLGISTPVRLSTEFTVRSGRNERLIDLCRETGSTIYVSGPAARNYLDEDLFQKEQIRVEWFSYEGYPEYEQLFPPFEHKVTILDLIFNEGPGANRFLKATPSK